MIKEWRDGHITITLPDLKDNDFLYRNAGSDLWQEFRFSLWELMEKKVRIHIRQDVMILK